jgi:hypothetical protein
MVFLLNKFLDISGSQILFPGSLILRILHGSHRFPVSGEACENCQKERYHNQRLLSTASFAVWDQLSKDTFGIGSPALTGVPDFYIIYA